MPKLGRMALTSDGRALAQIDGQILAENMRLGNITPGTVGQGALDMGAAIVKPITDPWKRGDYVEAVTRGAAELLSAPIAWTKAQKAAQAAKAKAALDAAEAAKAKAALDAAEAARAKAALEAEQAAKAGDGVHVARFSKAQRYAELINSNQPWSWKKDFPNGENLTAGEKAAIKLEAIEQGLIPNVQFKNGTKFPDFENAGLINKFDELPANLWKQGDSAQFRWLDARISGGRPNGFTWHHSEIPGKMELVPFGIHNIINHQGGRSPGLWAAGSR